MNRKSYILVRSMLEGDGVLLKKLHGRVPTAYKRSQGNSARFITTEGGRKALSVLVRRFRDDVVEYLQDEDPSVLNKFGDHLVNMHSLLVTMKEKLLDLYPLPPSGNLDKFFTCVRRYTDKLERKMKKKMKKMVAPDEDLEEEKELAAARDDDQQSQPPQKHEQLQCAVKKYDTL